MPTIVKILNNDYGDTVRVKLNAALASVAVDGTITGDGTDVSPLSIQNALNSKQESLGYTAENVANKDQVNGYAGLDASGLISPAQLPAIVTNDTFVVDSEASMLALSVSVGDTAVRTDSSETYILASLPATDIANWVKLLFPTSGGVDSFNGRTGAVTSQSNDYTWAQVNKTLANIIDIPQRDHADLTSVGVNTHAQIDSHISATGNVHGITLADLSGTPLTDFNNHENNASIHFIIDDSSTSTVNTYSSSKIDSLISATGHDPVSLGVEKNGLSLASGQVLSLNLATTGSAGALSGADKTKLDGAASDADLTTHTTDNTIHFVIDDITPSLASVYSSQRTDTLLNGKASQSDIDTSISTHTAIANAHHEPVSLGVTNGLSLADQTLSLALATTSTDGAMSSADKTSLDSVVANSHTHTNKANLDTINQNLATTDSPAFSHVDAGVNVTTAVGSRSILTSELNALIVADNGASNIVLTPPSGVPNFQVAIVRLGTGTVTISPPSGESIIEPNSLVGVKQNGGVTLVKITGTNWWMQGSTE